MSAILLDGRAHAADLLAKVRQAALRLPRKVRLATILVGDDPASAVYVAGKIRACGEAGLAVHTERLPADTSASHLAAVIDRLNADPAVHGILLQLPLPAPLQAADFIARIDPRKDVDGLHPHNAGLLAQGQTSGFIPCTPRGCLHLIKSVMPTLFARQALVIGRSLLVGRPLASLLLAADCTVTVAHSRSHDVPLLAQQAEILVVAAGSPGLVRRDWVRPGAVVIDVGITRTSGGLVGDVAPEAREVAGFLSPVPGGVGPMTIASLLANTLIAACRQLGQPVPVEMMP